MAEAKKKADEAAKAAAKEQVEAIDTPEDSAEEQAAEAAPSLEAEIMALQVERDELKDRLMRALAEAENTRKRGERDRKDAEAYGGTRLARDLLSVYDNLGRALESVDDDLRASAGAFIEGVELTRRELLSAFAKHKIEPVAPAPGEKFDPKMHQAMFEAPVPGSVPGTVIQVMQPGFVISDRLLRPAMVGVASAAAQAKPAEAPEEEPEKAAE
jgi:molecular chaperone GrpE